MSELMTIKVRKTTTERLKKHGQMHESYSDVIDRMMDFFEKHSKTR
jgi:predicted CopG family antitoxin